jgi:hypothetical protein
VYDLVQKKADVKVVVFHCALSQMRYVDLDWNFRLASSLNATEALKPRE